MALFAASSSGSEPVVRTLLEAKAPVDHANEVIVLLQSEESYLQNVRS
jgi:hypothetical protein